MITKYEITEADSDHKEFVCADCAKDFVSLNTGVARSWALTGNESVEFTVAGITFTTSPSSNDRAKRCGFCRESLTSTLTISIGRCVPDNKFHELRLAGDVGVQLDLAKEAWELSETDWLKFQESVETIFRNGKAETRATGESVWDGQEEDTCVFQWFNAPKPTKEQLEQLREIANKYGQDAIAVTYATPTFI